MQRWSNTGFECSAGDGEGALSADIVQESYRDDIYHQAGAAVTEQRQCQAGNRHEADRHTYIDEYLHNEHRYDTNRDQPCEWVGIEVGDLDAAGDDYRIKQQHEQTTQKPPLMSDDGEDEIVMPFRQ